METDINIRLVVFLAEVFLLVAQKYYAQMKNSICSRLCSTARSTAHHSQMLKYEIVFE